MNDLTACPSEQRITPYDEIVENYSLTILMEFGDWSLDASGGFVMTKDGNPQHGDRAYNGLFRLVEMWRHSEPHFRYLFEIQKDMVSRRRALDDDLNAVGDKAHDEIMCGHGFPSKTFAREFHEVLEKQAAATFGAGIYAGSLMLMLGSLLLRLKDDIEAKRQWATVGPLFNGHSVGVIIEAAANGFRHADEWAKTHPPTTQQKRSQDIIAAVLPDIHQYGEGSPGACVQLLAVLSGGTFKGLAANLFAFAHHLAAEVRQGKP